MAYLIAVVLLVASSRPARAYVDPGSGSYMLQMSLAGFLAVVFSIKMYWQRLRTWAASRFNGHSNPRARGGV